ncbi:MAG: pentapeptide repeat-containing protein [Candidatus Saccharimonadales bacterium]
MKLHSIKLADKSALTPIGVGQLTTGATLEQVYLQGAEAAGIVVKDLNFDESMLEKVVLAEARLERFSLTDSELRACDLSAARCSGASLIRVRVIGGRLTGLDLSRSTLKDVTFEDCKLDMANFRYAKLTRVRFINCMLAETDFQAAELHDITFEDCTLDRVEFGHARIKSVDTRSSQLIDIRGWEYLKGLTVDSMQLAAIAPQLALQIGLIIKD